MTETARNFYVGVFVILAFGVLGVLMVWFGESPEWLRRGEWTLKITGVRDLDGVADGSPVKLNGVEIGRVTSVDFKDPERPDLGVIVIARIKQQYTVPSGAVAHVYGATLGIGSGHVSIVVEPGASTEPLDKQQAVIFGEMRSVIGELISKDMIDSLKTTITNIGDLAATTRPVMSNLSDFVENRPIDVVDSPDRIVIANLTTAVERFDRLIANLNTVLGETEVQEDLKGVVKDMKNSSEQLSQLITLWNEQTLKIANNLNEGIDHTDEALSNTLRRANDVLDQLDDTSKSAANILNNVTEGKGTLGKLAYDDRLYEAGVLAMERLAEALGTLQRILGKIDREGRITVGRATPIGIFPKNYPIPLLSQQSTENTTP